MPTARSDVRQLPIPCPVCGGEQFAQGEPVISSELASAWRLSEDELALIERQQIFHCSTCGGSLRTMTLASAVMRHFGFDGVFEDLCRVDGDFRRSRILEMNEAGTLHAMLAEVPGHRLGTYPEMDMQRLAEPDGSWDVVIHSDTLEHVPDPNLALRECHRVLRPGGLLAMTVPLLPGRLTRRPPADEVSFHGLDGCQAEDYRVWTEFGADVWSAMMDAGFATVTLHSIDHPNSVAVLGIKPGHAPLAGGGMELPESDSKTPHRPALACRVNELQAKLLEERKKRQALRDKLSEMRTKLAAERERNASWTKRLRRLFGRGK